MLYIFGWILEMSKFNNNPRKCQNVFHLGNFLYKFDHTVQFWLEFRIVQIQVKVSIISDHVYLGKMAGMWKRRQNQRYYYFRFYLSLHFVKMAGMWKRKQSQCWYYFRLYVSENGCYYFRLDLFLKWLLLYVVVEKKSKAAIILEYIYLKNCCYYFR